MNEHVVVVETVAAGAKYCKCGGMMVEKDRGSILMSSPPRVALRCPFCGIVETVEYPYNIDIQFRKIADK